MQDAKLNNSDSEEENEEPQKPEGIRTSVHKEKKSPRTSGVSLVVSKYFVYLK
jgi:hypothetical protein